MRYTSNIHTSLTTSPTTRRSQQPVHSLSLPQLSQTSLRQRRSVGLVYRSSTQRTDAVRDRLNVSHFRISTGESPGEGPYGYIRRGIGSFGTHGRCLHHRIYEIYTRADKNIFGTSSLDVRTGGCAPGTPEESVFYGLLAAIGLLPTIR